MMSSLACSGVMRVMVQPVQMQISEARQQVAAAIQQVEAVREALNGRL